MVVSRDVLMASRAVAVEWVSLPVHKRKMIANTSPVLAPMLDALVVALRDPNVDTRRLLVRDPPRSV